MRVADVRGDWGRCITAPERYGQCIGFTGQRDALPVGAGLGPCRRCSRAGLHAPAVGPPRSESRRWAVPVSAVSSLAMQRVALPHASTSAPSWLRISMKASACRVLSRADDDQLIAADARVPVRDPPHLRLAQIDGAATRASSTTKSLPRPCILRKGRDARVITQGYRTERA